LPRERAGMKYPNPGSVRIAGRGRKTSKWSNS